MYVVISDDTEELLLTDEKFSNSSSQLEAELLREGVIGKINGVKVKTSSLLPEDVEFIVYAIDWCQAIDEWSIPATINDLADGKHIGASALQGRMEHIHKTNYKKLYPFKDTALIFYANKLCNNIQLISIKSNVIAKEFAYIIISNYSRYNSFIINRK